MKTSNSTAIKRTTRVTQCASEKLTQVRPWFAFTRHSGAKPYAEMGLGKLKNHQVKLNIDSSVPPVAQPQRRIPFHIRKKVKVAIKELESQGIIEKVPDSQPTPWQHLQGMAGVQNIADDILVFGSTRQEHDQALENCLKRLKEKGLTLNKSKCSFLNTELEFFGQIFSEQGTRPDPRRTQDVPPSELLFNRTVRGALPTLKPRTIVNRHKEAKDNEQKRCIYNKSYADLHRNAKESSIKVGDTVLVQQEKKQKLMPKFNTTPYKVIARKGTTVVAENKERHRITRNVSHFKQIPDINEMDYSSEEERNNEPEPACEYRRSNRTRRAPVRYGHGLSY
eukprot:gene5362-540_t